MNETFKRPPSPINLCDTIEELARSIAEEEQAIACLLNAECEKINRIVCHYDDIDTLIRIDESVLAVLEQIIILEGILKAKLDSLIPLLLECD